MKLGIQLAAFICFFTSVTVVSYAEEVQKQDTDRRMSMMREMMKDRDMMKEMCREMAQNPEGMRMMCQEMMKSKEGMMTMCQEMVKDDTMREMCRQMINDYEKQQPKQPQK